MESSRKLSPAEFEAAVFKELRVLLPERSRLCVGVSGGLDSMVLLSLLVRCSRQHPLQLSAIHVNHQLQTGAQQWQEFVQRQCQQLGVPLTITVVDVPLKAGLGLEAAAREARYQAYGDVNAEFLALAHHQDDQAETLLIQLLRGAGVQGLAAMPSMRPYHSLQLLRPLLSFTRKDLAAYAEQHQIAFVEDPSNQDERLVRNFLRQRLSPLLDQRFPAWRQTVSRSAELLGEAAQVLEQVALADLELCEGSEGLKVDRVLALGDARAANLLRYWLGRQGARPPGSQRLREWLRQSRAAHHRQPEMSWGSWRLFRHRGCWHLSRHSQPWSVVDLADFPVAADYFLPDGGCLKVSVNQAGGPSLRRDLPQGPWQLRCRAGGERIRPRIGGPSRTLKNLLAEAHIPAWQRPQWPLLFLGERLVAVPGLAVEAEFQVPAGGFNLDWLPPTA